MTRVDKTAWTESFTIIVRLFIGSNCEDDNKEIEDVANEDEDVDNDDNDLCI